MHKVLEEDDKPKKGGKRKRKVGPYEPIQSLKKKKNVKRVACKMSDAEDSYQILSLMFAFQSKSTMNKKTRLPIHNQWS